MHSAALSRQDRGTIDAIPVTSWARTLLDLVGNSSPGEADRLLERSEELDLFDLAKVDELLARSGHHPGARPLRRALDIYRPDPAFTRSGVERRFRSLVRRSGLPMPSMNFNLGGFELDAYWPAERFAVELDLYETHGSRAAFERDRIREDELLMLGVELIRVTGPRLKHEPEATIARVAAHLNRRRAA